MSHVDHARQDEEPDAEERPFWDKELRELWFWKKLVKRFRQPAECQTAILDEFQDKGWPRCIADPLPPDDFQDAKKHLHDAVQGLNRNQRNALLWFERDGKGGILWLPREEREPPKRRRRTAGAPPRQQRRKG